MELTCKALDEATIYYTLHIADKGKSDSVIILGHGLTGHRFEYIHQIADPIMTAAGYDVIRIAFNTDPKDARKLDECTVQTHADDLNDLIGHIRPNYRNIFYAGHSYGGLTALLANPKVNATAFWDSNYVPDFWDDAATYIAELDCYKIGWGVNALASRAMYEESKALNYNVMKEKASVYHSAASVFIAGANTEKEEKRELLYADLPEPKGYVVIDGASHCFLEKGTAESLAQETVKWFDRYN